MKPLVLLALLSLALPVFSQDIVTAAQFFNTVSEKYGSVNDYSAHVGIAQGKTTMDGTLYYKNPNKLNITFSNQFAFRTDNNEYQRNHKSRENNDP